MQGVPDECRRPVMHCEVLNCGKALKCVLGPCRRRVGGPGAGYRVYTEVQGETEGR